MEQRLLGQTGIAIGKVGISSSYGADCAVFEAALERGCNYFNWGTFIRGRSREFKKFMRVLAENGRRDKIVLGLICYSHSVFLGNRAICSALRQLHTDYIDTLILGYFSKRPPQRLIDWAQELKRKGVVRAIGMTTHNRKVVVPLAEEGVIDYFHIRYNAVHRGAEQDIFAHLSMEKRPGLVSFTATCWGKLLKEKNLSAGERLPTAGDCYRFVLANSMLDACMMGVRNMTMLEENLQEIEEGPLDTEQLDAMRRIGDHLYGKSR